MYLAHRDDHGMGGNHDGVTCIDCDMIDHPGCIFNF